jgi:hypothetical protein
MEQLPIDISHPAVREYLALVRLQVLTPLSLLINIACVATCAFVAHPSLSAVAKLYPTALTPNVAVIGAYVAAIYVGQIGYCVLLVFTRDAETKVRSEFSYKPCLIEESYCYGSESVCPRNRPIPSFCESVHGTLGHFLGAHHQVQIHVISC